MARYIGFFLLICVSAYQPPLGERLAPQRHFSRLKPSLMITYILHAYTVWRLFYALLRREMPHARGRRKEGQGAIFRL